MARKNRLVLLFAALALSACDSQIGGAPSSLRSSDSASDSQIDYSRPLAGRLGLQTPSGASPGNASVATPITPEIREEINRSYNLFYSPADHVEELLEENRVEVASLVYERQRDYFTGDRKKKANRLADTLAQKLAPQVASANQNLAATPAAMPPDSWPKIKSALSAATQVVDQVGEHDILREPGRELAGAADLRRLLKERKREVADKAHDAFLFYPLDGKGNFFDDYPVELDRKKFFDSDDDFIVKRLLHGGQPAQIAAAYKVYADDLPERTKTAFAEGYLDAVVTDERASGKAAPQAIVAAIGRIAATDLPLPRLQSSNFALLTVSPPPARADFPVSVTSEAGPLKDKLPQRNHTLETFDAADLPNADSVLVLAPTDVAAEREIVSNEKTASEYLAGYRTDPNPDYATAVAQVGFARSALQSAAFEKARISSQFCSGIACIIQGVAEVAASVAHGKREDEYQAAINTLSSTPQTVQTPVYQPYTFSKATVRVRRSADINYYLVDRKAKKIYTGVVERQREDNFTIPNGLHEDDRYRSRHLEGASPESAVTEHMTRPAQVDTATVLAEIAEAKLQPVAFTSPAQVASRIRADERKVARARADRKPKFTASVPQSDNRIHSVVVINRPSGGLGSGFFVDSNLLVTNFHVIEGLQFVDLKTADGKTSFGKVIATDQRRDLALVETKASGTPVKLYTASDLPLGKTVLAIGHPEGLNFSFTRGIISAVRLWESKRIRGVDPYRVIQTDTPINGGNSGGPLFLGQQVIGVNTFGLTDTEGLNFAIHYGEVRDFLARNGVTLPPPS